MPAVALGSVVVVMARVWIAIERLLVADCWGLPESVTFRFTVLEPLVGVPVIWPLLLIDRPAGRPVVPDQSNGEVPPLITTVKA